MSAPSKILLVDDEVHIRKYLAILARSSLGATTVIESANGADAFEKYRQERPDLVLLDINMPVRDGLETLEDIMEFDPEAAVIMLTSVSTRTAVEKAAARGALGYVLKDTPREELGRALRQIVEENPGAGPADSAPSS